MARDDFKNLGFGEQQSKPAAAAASEPPPAPEKGVKGELRW